MLEKTKRQLTGGHAMKQILVSAVFSALAILLIPSQLRPDEPVPAVPEDTVLWIEDAGPETLEGNRLGAGDRRFGNGSPAGRRHGAAAPDGRLSDLRRAVGNAAGIRIGGAEGAGRRRAYLYGKAPSLRKARKRRRLLRQRLLSGVAERGGAAGKIRRGF